MNLDPHLRKTIVNGVELHYAEHGSGAPLVLVHGGLADYREWNPQIPRFASRSRVITYSRRYNYPNTNAAVLPNYSALADSQDLAALVDRLRLEQIDLVGYSYGAFGALAFAIDYPKAVRSLVLAEPPIHRWVLGLPDGDCLFNDFMTSLWGPVGDAFRRGDSEAALRTTAEGFIGPGAFELLPADVKRVWKDNLLEWKALTCSQDAFPDISKADVHNLGIPTLLLAGENTLPVHQRVNDELESFLPDNRRITLPGATHAMWEEQPDRCGEAVVEFLAKRNAV